jgi:hypothetical protein
MVDSNGNLKIKIVTNNLSNGSYLNLDAFYLIGYTDLFIYDTAFSSLTTCYNTYGMTGIDSLVSQEITCPLASQNGYPYNFFALDDDDDASSSDYIFDAKLMGGIVFPSGSSINAIHYGFDIESNSSSATLSPQLRDYSSYSTGG